MRRRLISRGSNEADEIEQRVAIAKGEIEAAQGDLDGAPLYDVIVENKVLVETIKKVEGLLWP